MGANSSILTNEDIQRLKTDTDFNQKDIMYLLQILFLYLK